MRIKKGDQVKIIAGKDNGKEGKVVRILSSSEKIVVEGLNIVKKHSRPRKQGEKGQIMEVPMPISVSNVALICSKCSKPTRVGYKNEGKEKVRFCKKCGKDA